MATDQEDHKHPDKLELEIDDKEDQVTKAIGQFGRWQFKVFMIVSWTGMVNAWHMMIMSFYAPNADHWCKPPELFQNWSVEAWKNYSVPPDPLNPRELSRCKMYDRDYDVLPTNESVLYNISTVDCQFGWEFDRSHFVNSVENEWNLVCSREALAKTASSTYYGGVLVGVVVFGHISDWIGRKKCLMLIILTTFTAGVATAFVNSLVLFYITRFFVGMGGIGGFTTSFVLALELVDGDYRTYIGILKGLFWCVGYISLTAFGYFLHDWRTIQLCLSVPVALCFSFWCLIPESPRWLLSVGKLDQAHRVLKKAAATNKRKDPDFPTITKSEEDINQITMITVFKSPILRYRAINLYFNWMVIAFVFYGIISGMSSFGGNIIVNYFISGAIDVPSTFFVCWVLVKKGRRLSHTGFLLVAGLTCLATAGFEKGVYAYDWPIVTLAMIGKFFIGSAFGTVYVYTAELYPTAVRNSGVGTSSMFARVGSMCAPYVDLLRHLHPTIPMITFGVFSLAAGLLTLLLPETNKEALPRTIEDAEKLKRK